MNDSPDPDLWAYERTAAGAGFRCVAGLDEAGRGPLAGPVVAAAVVLNDDFPADDITDSKRLTAKTRDRLYDHIYAHARCVGIGIVDALEIDRINILNASLQAMALAAANVKPACDYLLIDGKFTIAYPLPQQAIVKGDALSLSISAASIVAKVTRDRMMMRYHDDYPQFGFDRHKGYPTRAHREAIRRHGFCPIHRQSFRGVKSQPVQRALFDG